MRKYLIGIVLLLVVGGFAFVSLGGIKWLDSMGFRGQERVLRSRIVGYWDARLDGDRDLIAQYQHPEQKEVFDPGMLVTESYDFVDLQIDGDTAVAKVDLVTYIKHPMLSAHTQEAQVRDEWVLVDGTWYRAVQPVSLGQMIRAMQEKTRTANQEMQEQPEGEELTTP